MASVAAHFERLCCCLEEAATIEDLDERAEYLRAVAQTIRSTPRNHLLRIWFLERTLELLGIELPAEADSPAAV